MPAPKGNQFAKGKGRPTKIKKEFCDQAKKLALLGMDDKEIACFFGVCIQTINNWCATNPSFLSAIRDGREKADAEVVNTLYDKATSGDITAITYWLRNRRKGWNEKLQIDQKVETTHKIALDNLSEEERSILARAFGKPSLTDD